MWARRCPNPAGESTRAASGPHRCASPAQPGAVRPHRAWFQKSMHQLCFPTILQGKVPGQRLAHIAVHHLHSQALSGRTGLGFKSPCISFVSQQSCRGKYQGSVCPTSLCITCTARRCQAAQGLVSKVHASALFPNNPAGESTRAASAPHRCASPAQPGAVRLRFLRVCQRYLACSQHMRCCFLATPGTADMYV